jgi:hypothetical protein
VLGRVEELDVDERTPVLNLAAEQNPVPSRRSLVRRPSLHRFEHEGDVAVPRPVPQPPSSRRRVGPCRHLQQRTLHDALIVRQQPGHAAAARRAAGYLSRAIRCACAPMIAGSRPRVCAATDAVFRQVFPVAAVRDPTQHGTRR